MFLSKIVSEYADRYSSSLQLQNQSEGVETNVLVENVGCNSRDIGKDWLFCCVPGEFRDGHDFAGEALLKGASALLTERPLPLEIPQIISSDVRKDMGRLASIVYGDPASALKMFAVTGTNGKSTTTWIIRHLLQSIGFRTGLMGTIVYNDGVDEQDASRTTPESCDVQRMLANMLQNGCTACVMETSSHGLELGRIEGCLFDGTLFTNLSEEHLDYHGTIEKYFSAKSRLFAEYTKQQWAGGVNVDDPFGRWLFSLHPNNLVPFGLDDAHRAVLQGSDVQSTLEGTRFSLTLPGTAKTLPVFLPLPGRFNVYNALAALSVTLPYATEARSLVEALSSMVQVPGRMETFSFENGVRCIIDFAHTPVALQNVLTEVRRLCDGRVISVFGHGGGRFQPNRQSLGRVAASLADEIIITMDNPRDEPPEQIAAQIAKGVASSERKISSETVLDRTSAVYEAMNSAQRGDVVVISGKGPEKFLHIGTESIPYSDGDTLRRWARERTELEMNSDQYVSSVATLANAVLSGPDGPLPARFVADSRLVVPGDAFVAFHGDSADGHDYIPDAVSRGASLIICENRAGVPDHVASILVDNCFSAIPKMARRYLEMHRADLEIIAVTGSVGKTTTREMIRTCLAPSFKIHSAEHSYNTLIGCALSILAMPANTDILILEMGTNHPGEIREMVEFFPPTISLITEIMPAHLEGLGSVAGVLEAKIEITESPFLKTVFYLGDNPLLASRCTSLSSDAAFLSVGFGESDFTIRDANFSLIEGLPQLAFSVVYKQKIYRAVSSLFGRHSALAAGFGIAVALYLGASIERALSDIRALQPPTGRGRFFWLASGALLLDDSYNANPASMKASLSESLPIPAKKRIAVLGEMRELGDDALAYHREIVPYFERFSKVFLTGTLWRDLYEKTRLPPNTCFFESSLSLGAELLAELGEGDFLVIKGSHGNRLDRIVDVLIKEGVR